MLWVNTWWKRDRKICVRVRTSLPHPTLLFGKSRKVYTSSHEENTDFPWIIDTPDSWSTLPRWLWFFCLFSIFFSGWWWLSVDLTKGRGASRAHLGFPSTTWSCLRPCKVFFRRGHQLRSAIFPSSSLSSFLCSPLLGSLHILHTHPHWMCTLDTVAPQGLCHKSPQGLISGEEEGCTMWRATRCSWWSSSYLDE